MAIRSKATAAALDAHLVAMKWAEASVRELSTS